MTLTETALATKKAMVFATIALVTIIIAWSGYQYYYHNIYLPSQPKPEEQPTLKYGTIPPITLTKSTATSSNYSYTLATETGALPSDIPRLIKVFVIPQQATTLLASDKARSLAYGFKFINGPEVISPTLHKFTDINGNEFIIDLSTSNFKLRRAIASDSALPRDNLLPDPNKIVEEFKGYLSSHGLMNEDLSNGKTQVTYDATIQKDSSFATVSLWQSDVEQLPIITPEFKNGLIKAKVNKFREIESTYQELDYTYWPIDLNDFGTYPTKPVATAFEQLKNGQGIVLAEPKTPKVSIASVYLGYLLTEDYNPLLHPVYVFESPDFAAVVSAVSDEYITK